MLTSSLNHLLRVRDAIAVRWWRTAGPPFLRARGVETEGSITLYGMPIIAKAKGSSIRIGRGAVLCSVSRFTALSVAKPVTLRTLLPGAEIEIGADGGLSGTVICAATAVHVGEQCLFGADVQIMDTDFHPVPPENRRYNADPSRIHSAPIRIGRNVFVGRRCLVLRGVEIGDDAVIGAGSVVTKSIPKGSIAVGCPARVVGSVYPLRDE